MVTLASRLGLALLALVASTSLAGDSPEKDAEEQAVVEVLQAQARAPVDRRAMLLSKTATSGSVARWQAGFVLRNGDWRSFDDLSLSARESEVRENYRDERRAAPQTAAGQRKLGNWCQSNGLLGEAYAHRLAAVTLNPGGDNGELLSCLGYRQVGDVWMSPEELTGCAREMELAKSSLARWGKALSRTGEQLSSPGRKRVAALRALSTANEASAVPALEWFLCGHSEAAALAAVDRLAAIDAFESTQALARQAVFNSWESARDSATTALFDRKYEDYVPSYIALLATPIEGQWSTCQDGRGHFAHNWVLARETENQFQIETYEGLLKIVETPFAAGGPDRDFFSRFAGQTLLATRELRAQADQQRLIERELFLTNQRLAELNEQTAVLNHRIGDVLASVTGESSRETPRDWWDWWNGYNQYETKRPKKVIRRERKQARTQLLRESPSSHPSCLVAGTKVWTNAGPQSVEELRIGDQLLSQDVETAELGYVPVLETTTRAPTTVYRIALPSHSITATGGHRFWVSGEGWRRVNDLKPGSLLHTATGSVEVMAIESMPDAAVYNVVVAPTHNYFVGEQALLTHDVTLPRPTNRKVPGLVEP